jgi:hypothetical protein
LCVNSREKKQFLLLSTCTICSSYKTRSLYLPPQIHIHEYSNLIVFVAFSPSLCTFSSDFSSTADFSAIISHSFQSFLFFAFFQHSRENFIQLHCLPPTHTLKNFILLLRCHYSLFPFISHNSLSSSLQYGFYFVF